MLHKLRRVFRAVFRGSRLGRLLHPSRQIIRNDVQTGLQLTCQGLGFLIQSARLFHGRAVFMTVATQTQGNHGEQGHREAESRQPPGDERAVCTNPFHGLKLRRLGPRRHGVVALGSPWMAFGQPTYDQSKPMPCAPHIEGFQGVLTARRLMSTVAAKPWTQQDLIGPNEPLQKEFHRMAKMGPRDS